MHRLQERYISRTPESARAFGQARQWMADGVAGDVKRVHPHPPQLRGGRGSYLEDVDGNRMLDMRRGASSLIFGHSFPPVMAAIRRQLEAGLLLSLPTHLDAELAERVCTHMPPVERVRFVNSGSEATIFAVRAARAVTGRPLIAKFEGSFHGHANESLLVSTGTMREGPAERPTSVAACAGLAPHVIDDVLVLPFDDPDSARTLIEQHADELAAVVMEPLPVSGAVNPPGPRLLQTVRDATRQVGALLVFDEMITGFRLGLGGASAYFGVTPDLVAMGKVLGGGMPIGAYGGDAQVMASVAVGDGSGPTIRQSGTFSGYPLSMAAGVATLDELERRDVYPDLRDFGAQLRAGLADAVHAAGVDAQVSGIESLFHITFTDKPVTPRRAAAAGDPVKHRVFCLGMMAEGVFMMPGQPGFLSAAHTADDVAYFVEAVGRVLPALD